MGSQYASAPLGRHASVAVAGGAGPATAVIVRRAPETRGDAVAGAGRARRAAAILARVTRRARRNAAERRRSGRLAYRPGAAGERSTVESRTTAARATDAV